MMIRTVFFSDRQVAVGRGTRQTVVPIPEGMFFSHSSTIGEDRLVLEFDNETTGEYACGLYGLSGDTPDCAGHVSFHGRRL